MSDKERHLPSQRVIVHLVDEKLIDTGLPQAELILTTFGKLLSDLTAYSGAPDVQGLLVFDFESGDFIQIFDRQSANIGIGDIVALWFPLELHHL